MDFTADPYTLAPLSVLTGLFSVAGIILAAIAFRSLRRHRVLFSAAAHVLLVLWLLISPMLLLTFHWAPLPNGEEPGPGDGFAAADLVLANLAILVVYALMAIIRLMTATQAANEATKTRL